jgi:hypothetical protein
MSTDRVNSALTNVRLRIERNPQNFSSSGQSILLSMCGVMRDFLMKEDVAGFTSYTQARLASEPDAMDYLLEELFDALSCQIWEDLEKKLVE